MADFRPSRAAPLAIGPVYYHFTPHPLFPDEDEVYAIEGGEAVIYQLWRQQDNTFWALKVSHSSFRGPHIARSTDALRPFAHLPGLYLGNRVCLTKAHYGDLINRFPDLEYAVLMPWITGRTWAGFLADRAANAQYTRQQALDLAVATAHVLWDLEAHSLAHTDIAGGNIVLGPDFKRVELLDIENLYIPNSPQPVRVSRGTPGYQHRNLDARGNWRPDGDRFAGAIILAEMLALSDPYVRAKVHPDAETLFLPYELQSVNAPLWSEVRDALWNLCQPALHLFDLAWAAPDLAQCPTMEAWAITLIQARGQGQ